jgi:hypothetical protein
LTLAFSPALQPLLGVSKVSKKSAGFGVSVGVGVLVGVRVAEDVAVTVEVAVAVAVEVAVAVGVAVPVAVGVAVWVAVGVLVEPEVAVGVAGRGCWSIMMGRWTDLDEDDVPVGVGEASARWRVPSKLPLAGASNTQISTRVKTRQARRATWFAFIDWYLLCGHYR